MDYVDMVENLEVTTRQHFIAKRIQGKLKLHIGLEKAEDKSSAVLKLFFL